MVNMQQGRRMALEKWIFIPKMFLANQWSLALVEWVYGGTVICYLSTGVFIQLYPLAR